MSDLSHLMDHAADDYGGWRVLIAAQGRQAALAYLADPDGEGITTEVVGAGTVRITVTLTDDQLDAALHDALHAAPPTTTRQHTQ